MVSSSSSGSMPASAAQSEVGQQTHIQDSSGPAEARSGLSFESEAFVATAGALLDSLGID